MENIGIIKTIVAFVIAFAITFCICTSISALGGEQTQQVNKLHCECSEECSNLTRLINVEREKSGLHDVCPLPSLNASAYVKAQDLLEYDCFDHYCTGDFGVLILSYTPTPGLYGENLAMGYEQDRVIIEKWMNSEGHRKNVLEPRFNYIGEASIYGDYSGYNSRMVVHHFSEFK